MNNKATLIEKAYEKLIPLIIESEKVFETKGLGKRHQKLCWKISDVLRELESCGITAKTALDQADLMIKKV